MSPDPRRIAALLAGLVLACGLAAAGDGERRWSWEVAGVRLVLEPLAPEAVAAFYAARGFPEGVAGRIAGACVLQTRLVNGSSTPVVVDLGRWRIHPESGGERPLPDRRAWISGFEREGVSPRARIAFEWSQFPWRVELQPGEELRGMIVYGLQPGTVFDVSAPVQAGGRWREARFERVQCPRQGEAAALEEGGDR